MEKQVGITRIFILLIILLHVVPIINSSAADTDNKNNFVLNSSQEVILDALDWECTPISCFVGDTISGEFTLTNNGDLFIGDQTKYDNWLLDGIDFLILNATNYEFWLDGLATTSLYERKGVVELSWNIDIPTEGIWYIIFYNDSIFMKQVEFSIQHISQVGFTYTIITTTLLGLAALLVLFFIFKKKK